MREYLKFYIDGKWVDPVAPKTLDVINPATEAVAATSRSARAADVDSAVKAARKAFETFSQTSREERIDLLERIMAEYKKRHDDMADGDHRGNGRARLAGAARPGRDGRRRTSAPRSRC